MHFEKAFVILLYNDANLLSDNKFANLILEIVFILNHAKD